MQNNEDLFHLWQQILKFASSTIEPGVMLAEIAHALGTAFGVKGCLLLVPGGASVCWLAASPTATVQLDNPELPVLEEQLNLFESIALINLESLSPEAKRSLPISPWLELLETVEISGIVALQVKAVLGIPIQFQGTTIGILSLLKSHSHPWTEAEIEGLQSLSQPVAIVLSQIQLQHQLTRQTQYQAVINQLTVAIRNTSDLNQILQLATNGTAQALQIPRGILLRLKYWEPLFRNRVQETIPKVRTTVACEWLVEPDAEDSVQPVASVLNQSFWMSECALCQFALLHPGSSIAIANHDQLPKFDPGTGVAPLFKLEKFPALLLSPLESQGTVLGFLVFQHQHPHNWKPEEIELVELVSAQVSTAIIQTETLRQVQALVDKRTAELQQSLSIQAKLYERTRQQVDQLRHLNQLKDEFLSTVSHELRTPLTSMTMAIRMLRQIGLSADRSARYLDILEQQCAQETNLINDLLALQELEAKQVAIQLEEIDLKVLLKDLVDFFDQKWSTKGLTLDLNLPKKPLKLHSDRDSLNRVLLELLTNAGKYSNPNSQIQLRVVHQIDHPIGRIVLTLCNIGSGISPEDLPHIFEKFRRSQGVTQNAIQGTGLGLALVQSLVQLLNGTITVSSGPIEDNPQTSETCFTLTLPQSFDNAQV
ncbi:GAF domain-containing protein [Kovacikia minuta CCNUW1]|uniref:sensor histidine kinase n=1 Tax=Kovacikia minuta TaxID=2931930 RepID=UPI001CCE2E7E|nr:ATP-binding protein [Kovacikia minuta]UBF29204.1 GAF domain-containing protein [Kovacikia minuta CCNUW1]